MSFSDMGRAAQQFVGALNGSDFSTDLHAISLEKYRLEGRGAFRVELTMKQAVDSLTNQEILRSLDYIYIQREVGVGGESLDRKIKRYDPTCEFVLGIVIKHGALSLAYSDRIVVKSTSDDIQQMFNDIISGIPQPTYRKIQNVAFACFALKGRGFLHFKFDSLEKLESIASYPDAIDLMDIVYETHSNLVSDLSVKKQKYDPHTSFIIALDATFSGTRSVHCVIHSPQHTEGGN